MKNIKKSALLFALAMVGCFGFVACQDDEELNLNSYPNPEIGFEVGDTGSSRVNLNATYDLDGNITVNGEMTRSYLPKLSRPCIEDRTFTVEPIIVNIPEDQVEISAREFTIRAGMQSPEEPITVTLLDTEYTFTEAEKAEKTYQLGLRVVGNDKLDFVDDGEGKVILKKECYTSHFSIESVGENPWTNFEVYHSLYRKKLYGKELKVEFKVKLDRPALEDISFTPSVALPLDDHRITHMMEVFPSCVHFSPETILIKQGEKESEVITLNLDQDFLLLKDERESVRDIKLTASLAAESKWFDEKLMGEPINISITKNMYDRTVLVRQADNQWEDRVEIRKECVNGEIVGGPVSMDLVVKTMGTVFEDVTVDIEVEGVPAKFAGDSKLSKTRVTIPAGKDTATETITWTLAENLLLETPDPIAFDFKIKPVLTEPENIDIQTEEQSPLSVKVKKVVQFMKWGQKSDMIWTKYPTAGWSIRLISDIYDQNNLFDGIRSSYARAGWASSYSMRFEVDMKEIKKVRGIEFWSANEGTNGCMPKTIEIHVSKDGSKWKELGMLDCTTPTAGDKYILTTEVMEAQYIKVLAEDLIEPAGWDWFIKLGEMIVYGD